VQGLSQRIPFWRHDSRRPADVATCGFRSGKRPDGSAINSAMPFGTLSQISDEDINALYSFLKTVPAAKHSGRP
jgi:hypothetical protein